MIKPVRFLLALFLSFFLVVTSVTPAFAQPPSPYSNLNTNPDVPQNFHTYTQTVMLELLASLSCQITGFDPLSKNNQCLGYDTKTGTIGYVENGGGAIGIMSSFIAMTYQSPIRTSDYVRYLGNNFGVAKPAYAQTGFEGLSPMLKLWTVFRNLVYLLFVIVFLVIGMAIMLRVKIDPRTVMTIENQLPRIIVALILITFSFAIAGFLIDLMYVVIYMLFNLATTGGFFTNPDSLSKINNVQARFNGENVFGVFNNLVGLQEVVTTNAGAVKDIVSSIFYETVKIDTSAPWYQVVWSTITSGFWTQIRNLVGGTLGVIAGVLAIIIIGIAVLWALFKIWFALISAYIFILLDVVLAPFWIMIGIFPGSSVNFGLWMRDILAYISAFPVTIGMFLFGKVLIEQFSTGNSGYYFVAPLIGNQADPKAFGDLLGLGIILMTPQVVQMTKDLLKAPTLKYTASIGQAVGAGQAGFGRVADMGKSAAFGMHYEEQGGHTAMVARGGALGNLLRRFGAAH